MSEPSNFVECCAFQLEEVADYLEGASSNRFGYSERLMVERPMFLLLKHIVKGSLGREIHGFRDVERYNLRSNAEEMGLSDLSALIRRAFELYLFISHLSSRNAYVRDEALSQTDSVRSEATLLVVRHARRLAAESRAVMVRKGVDDG